MRARKPESPLAYVYDGQRCLGHVLGRGKLGFEAFTANEQSIALFATARQAADGLLIKGGVA
jgi:hypothetical protein